jgi:hypothetical protein
MAWAVRQVPQAGSPVLAGKDGERTEGRVGMAGGAHGPVSRKGLGKGVDWRMASSGSGLDHDVRLDYAAGGGPLEGERIVRGISRRIADKGGRGFRIPTMPQTAAMRQHSAFGCPSGLTLPSQG